MDRIDRKILDILQKDARQQQQQEKPQKKTGKGMKM